MGNRRCHTGCRLGIGLGESALLETTRWRNTDACHGEDVRRPGIADKEMLGW